jgi:hypothetical protein
VGRLTILTWHIHGSYLDALGHTGQDIVVPVRPGRPERFAGRPDNATWPATIREVPADAVKDLDVDLVLYQHAANWAVDQHEILSTAQLQGPRVFVEHDPPRQHPTDTRHPVDDPDVTIVHVTRFNQLMWDTGRTPTTVIEHGVQVPDDVQYDGSLERGIAVVNGLAARGRRLGADIFDAVRTHVPLDLVGMRSEEAGGLGEVEPPKLPSFLQPYRFYFHPIRYTSLGLALCEAMAVGLPVVGLATTELPTVIDDGVNGFIDTDIARLVDVMHRLLDDRELARRVGAAGRATACERFGIDRFVRDWEGLLERLCGRVGRTAMARS